MCSKQHYSNHPARGLTSYFSAWRSVWRPGRYNIINMKRIIVAIIILILASCTKTNVQPSIVQKTQQDTIPIIKQDSAPIRVFDSAEIVCLGNSLTFGYLITDSTQTYPGQLKSLLDTNNVTVINRGHSGYSTEQLEPLISIDATPFYKSEFKNIAIVWEIGNSIFWNKMTADSAYGIFVNYCNQVKEQGFKVIVITLPYRNNFFANYPITPGGDDSTTYSLKLDSANILLRNNYASFADGIADIQLNPHLQYYDPNYYQPDHTHLKAPGYAIVAGAVYKAITKLY